MPQRPYTIDGIDARSSVRNVNGARSQFGQNSDRKIAIPIATGAAIESARIDEYSVPQMNGAAPNSPRTGFHCDVVQKLKPNR